MTTGGRVNRGIGNTCRGRRRFKAETRLLEALLLQNYEEVY